MSKALRTASIVGTGMYVPEKVMTNHDLEKLVDTSDEWIFTRTGMKERRVAAGDQATSSMAAAAAEKALADAGVSAEDVDLIVVATMTPDMQMPSTACRVQDKIGASNAYCYDLSAACTGFLYGLQTVKAQIESGAVETALVIGAEKMSSCVDWDDRTTCVLFGDGAGAAVLRAGDKKFGITDAVCGSNGKLWELLHIPAGGSAKPLTADLLADHQQCLKMGGREVFKHAVKSMVTSSFAALEKNGLTMDDIALVIPHQANVRIINAIVDRVGSPEKVFINLEKYGNTSGATLGIALDEARREGRVKEGDLVLLTAFGGGFTWGAMVLEL
ncbi:beta-ketoacyl-ACP synthase III [Verrucomicrobiota bacterium]